MKKKIFTYPLLLLAIMTLTFACSKDDPAPEVSFEIDGGNTAAPSSVSFINNTLHANSYEWDFGDGNTSTETNPTHTYEEAGRYTVKLTATNEEGSNSATGNVYVYGEVVSWSPSRITVTKEKWSADEGKVAYAILRNANGSMYQYWDDGEGPNVEPISFAYGDTFIIQNFSNEMTLNTNSGSVKLEIRWAPEGGTIYPEQDEILFEHTINAADVFPSSATDPYITEYFLESDGVIVDITFHESE